MIAKIQDLDELVIENSNIIVVIGNPEIRLSLLRKISEETPYRIVSLVSPKAYVSPTAQVMEGCIIEPMAVVQTGCLISTGALFLLEQWLIMPACAAMAFMWIAMQR